MKGQINYSSWVAWIDGSISSIFALLFLWVIYAANEAVVEAAHLYGRNVDSGALAYAADLAISASTRKSLLAMMYFLPAYQAADGDTRMLTLLR